MAAADLERAVKVKEAYEDMLLAKPNVHGVDVGFKYEAGNRTDEVVIRVFVTKVPDLPEGERIPAMLDGIEVVVMERPIAVPQYIKTPVNEVVGESSREKFRPLVGGLSVGPCRLIGGSYYAGTLGAIVKKDDSANYALSNFHVLCVDKSWAAGQEVSQPSPADGGSWLTDGFGGIYSGCLATVYNCEGRSVDAALATISTSTQLSYTVYNIGVLTGIKTPSLGTAVRKQGRTTDLTFGSIDGISGTFSISYGALGTITLTNQITIVPNTGRNPRFSDHGDSGSVIVDDHNNFVGLLFAGAENGSYSIANRSTDVQAALAIKLPVPHEFAAVTTGIGNSNNLQVIALGKSDGQLYVIWQDSSGVWRWHGLLPNPDRIAFVTVAAGLGNSNNLQVIALGQSDGLPYLTWQDSSTGNWSWSGPLPNPQGLTFSGLATGIGNDNNLQVILLGTADGFPYLIWQDSSGVWHWSGALPDQQEIAFSNIATGNGNDGNLQVGGIGKADSLPYLIWQSASTGKWRWHGALPVGPEVLFSTTATGPGNDGNLQVIGLSKNNGLLYLIWQQASNGKWLWSGPLPGDPGS